MAELRRWVSDQLMDIVGFAEQNVVEFIISFATKSPKIPAVLSMLASYDVPSNSKSQAFVSELVNRVPRKMIAVNIAKVEAKKAIEINRQNDSFTLLEDSDGNEELTVKVKKKTKKRKRSPSPKATPQITLKDTSNDTSKETKESAEERKIRERDEDRQARDEFDERRREAEKKKTKRLVEAKDKSAIITDEDFANLLPELRQTSRFAYLKKREGIKLEELRRIVKDEEFLFGDGRTKLTREEREKHALNKELLRLAEERLRLRSETEVAGYQMPDTRKADGVSFADARLALLSKRYVEEKAGPSDYQQWDELNAKLGVSKFGAQDAKSDEKHYDFVFDDQVAYDSTYTFALIPARYLPPCLHLSPRLATRGDRRVLFYLYSRWILSPPTLWPDATWYL